MIQQPLSKFHQRVVTACENVLKRNRSVGLIELFEELNFLPTPKLMDWKHGKPHATPLENVVQVGTDKFWETAAKLVTWAEEKGLQPIQVPYERQGVSGPERLKILKDDTGSFKDVDDMWRRHWIPSNLSAKQAEKLEEKLTKPQELAVFSQAHDKQICAECQTEMLRGELFALEHDQPICLTCADMDHLELLPAGNATLTRRARKFSALAAVVLQFNRRRKRYDRLGLLVTPEAIEQAEASCEEDASERAVQRVKAKATRQKEDAKLVENMTAHILEAFPNCPPVEARSIAVHTAERGSGRVGRSAAGRELDAKAIELAVIASIRHQHTGYDRMLMEGVARMDARGRIRDAVQKKLNEWR